MASSFMMALRDIHSPNPIITMLIIYVTGPAKLGITAQITHAEKIVLYLVSVNDKHIM